VLNLAALLKPGWFALRLALGSSLLVTSMSAQTPTHDAGLKGLYEILSHTFETSSVVVRTRNGSELSIELHGPSVPDTTPVPVARRIGEVVRTRYKGYQTLTLLTVAIVVPNSRGFTRSVVVLKPEQLVPGDTSAITMFISRQY